ncbi:MAG: hypothetical protein II097_07250 [Bacteroidales bacterium]|nr:hypothetical protein [Bacteroidales bacterium]
MKAFFTNMAIVAFLLVPGCDKTLPVSIAPLDQSKELTDLSGIIDCVKLVQLESLPDNKLGYPDKVLVLQDGSFVLKDKRCNIKVQKYSRDGKYLCGFGGGEKVQDICLGEDQSVCILGLGNIVRYDSRNGAFLDSLAIPLHNYDEFCRDGHGGYWIFAAAPDFDHYDFDTPFPTLYHFPAGASEPTEELLPRKDYIMNTALITQAADGSSLLRPLEGENILYSLGKKVRPLASFDFKEKAIPRHYMIYDGFPDYGRYMPSAYFKYVLYVHNTTRDFYFATIGPGGDLYNFVFTNKGSSGICWKDLRDTDTPSVVRASDKEGYYVLVYDAGGLVTLPPEKLSPLNRIIVEKIRHDGLSLNGNPLIAKITVR